jgi:hypothetical protein
VDRGGVGLKFVLVFFWAEDIKFFRGGIFEKVNQNIKYTSCQIVDVDE